MKMLRNRVDATPDSTEEKPQKTAGKLSASRRDKMEVALRYFLLFLMLVISVGPFLLQLSNSLKGPNEDIYAFPPQLIPQEPTLENYAQVSRSIPIFSYAWHSLVVSVMMVVSNVVLSTMAGYGLAVLKFRGKAVAIAVLLSTLLLPGEVTLTSQYLTIKTLGLTNSLVGVFLPTAVTAINVLLMWTAARSIPPAILDAATLDGANTWQQLRYVVWPNVRGMVAVVALMSFIQAWDDFLWPLVVLSDPEKYTLTVGMQYLNASTSFGANPRVVAAGTIIALIPIIVLFALTQKMFFRGVESGGVKG